ncbi:adenylate/guanylate cyclase domain-containing protein [Candidatus Venteria ishoeyi]|uniref:adenylate/guanylate cyclase domain-containing protein n=1 Tax=Candidatus Venteria ishoeyi TaxID=1899563 RepID=UPI0025A569EC|nr:adenylate/guanylate cyclase domain-containing protein [Candidatus Venteria ishoeyi]MDM8547714.1 adenylate/guanylate cyclase domain-containing protein [Candidatus Venteria ishoeyi]
MKSSTASRPLDLDERLHGTLKNRIMQEFFANTAHFPIANIFLELLIEGPGYYFSAPDFYILLFACLLQATIVGRWQYAGTPHPFIGNLIAPAIYTVIELSLGDRFFDAPNHLAYWGFALAIGCIQQIRLYLYGWSADLLIILENVIRASIVLVMYWVFGMLAESDYHNLTVFFADASHIFLAITILLIGLMMGFARRDSENFLLMLRDTGEQLRRYSEWLLGKDRLAPAMADPASLSLNRRRRCVLFMDIRGFTRWSEAQSPEAVVSMLNRYCETAEYCWAHSDVIKAKLTGDEIMIVFAAEENALKTALCLHQRISLFLDSYGLGAGIGLHAGPLVEGLIGGEYIKAYDIIGDTVNTAKRLCDHAKSGEILLSSALYQSLESPPAASKHEIQVKGKSAALTVFSLAK